MTGWKRHKLGELGTFINGKAFNASHWKDSGLPIIRIQNLTDAGKPFNYFQGSIEDRYKVNDGDLLVSWSATLDCFLWNRGPAVLNQHIFRVVPNTELVDRDFLFYLLKNSLAQMEDQAHGLAMKHITKSKFDSLPVLLPSLTEQRRIVARIKECMDRIDEIEQLRSASACEGRTLATAVFGDFLEEFKATGVETVPLGSVLVDVRYGTSQKSTAAPSGIPVLRMGNIQNGRITTNDLKYMNASPSEVAKYKLVEGDILINRTNSMELVGKAGLFSGLGGDWVYASYLVRLRVDRARVLPEYVNAVINSRIGRDYVLKTARRAISMVNINAQEIRRLPLPLPSLEGQAAVVDRIKQSEVLIDQLATELRPSVCPPLRASVLAKAFAGEL